MPLQKQSLSLSFGTSLDLKTDPLQLSPLAMLGLDNIVFTKDKRLGKRNGFGSLQALPSGANATTLTTFNSNLTAIGNNLYSYNSNAEQWITSGRFQPVQLSVLPLVRSQYSQSALDSALGSGMLCTAYIQNSLPYYTINDAVTGQTLLQPQALPSSAQSIRVFYNAPYFLVMFMATVSGAPRLQRVAIRENNIQSPGAVMDVSTLVNSVSTAWDGIVASNGNLYLAWGGTSTTIKAMYMTATLEQSNTVVAATGRSPALMSLCADSTPVIYVSYYTTSGTALYTLALAHDLTTVLAETSVSTANTLNQITSTVANQTCTLLADVANNYGFDSSIHTDYINRFTVTQGGTVAGPALVSRSVGLASKSFIYNSTIYFLASYTGVYQPSYFLLDSSGNVVAKLAYSNGGGYISTLVLPQANLSGSVASIGYQYRDLLLPVNKTQGAASISGVYAQTGLNMASFNLASSNLVTAEIGQNLHIAGGFLWMYDGSNIVEHGFHLWPESIEATWSVSGGSMAAQPDGSTNTNAYYYQVTYEWTDAQGNIHRSAPSIPIAITTTGSGSTGSVSLNIPTLRLSYKTGIKIVIYRWSVGQQTYYQVTSVTSPTLNDPTVDYITYTDTLADASIIGNSIIYTNGGVVENIAAPACSSLALFKSRLMILSSEDPNSIWYSKQVIESTPVETSDLFTIYTAPTTGAQGSTGSTKTLNAMDDKFIMGKTNAFYYLVGNGPDNTGANNDFSDPIFISSTVGCANQQSYAFMPNGLMFQSNKGIWLLGRDLSTSYIGARVEDFNSHSVTSAQVIPNTNQVRFCLDNGQFLMYDYYFDRWGTFSNVPSVSSTLYQSYHTLLDASGNIAQETPGVYQDGSRPVLMSLTTAWLNLAGLQGLERVYFMFLLGTYLSPHKLQLNISYDYQNSPAQSILITPDNASYAYGDDPQYGDTGPYGGVGNSERWRIFFNQQTYQAIQVNITEVYDASQGLPPGAGLTLSGLNFIVGLKKSYRNQSAARSVG